MAKLDWRNEDFNQFTVDATPYRYTIWENPHGPSELRIIRRENLGGIITPMYDFSIFTSDVKSAKKLAKKINKEFQKQAEFNPPATL
jgi:hypothetical protein